MNAKSKIYILIVVILIVLVAVLDTKVPKPMNWNERYDINGTMPFDLKVMHSELGSYKKWNTFKTLDSTFYQYSSVEFSDSFPKRNLAIYIGNNFGIDYQSELALLDFVANGNDFFLSVNSINIDNLDFSDIRLINKYLVSKKEVHIELYNTSIHDSLNKLTSYTFISDYSFRPDYYKLGYIKEDYDEPKINFIKIKYGEGNIYIHTSPFVFSNYYLLYVNQSMAETIFSSLDNTDAIFLTDAKYQTNTSTHLLQFIFQNKTLTWAWYISLGALLVFIIFNAKRRQRIIPIIKPLENTTIAFTQTISNMFYERKDHDFVAEKRIVYFLDYVRNRYHLDTTNLTSEFIDTLSKRSGVSISTTEILIGFINKFNKFKNIPESQLIHLDRLLEEFKNEEQSLTQK